MWFGMWFGTWFGSGLARGAAAHMPLHSGMTSHATPIGAALQNHLGTDSAIACFDRALIDRFEAGATVPARAIAGLTREQLLAVPIAGTWSIQQIIVHLWESDMAAVHRMRRTIAEAQPPLIIAYDESALARELMYEQEDVERACRMFEDGRRLMARLLRKLPDEAFAKYCIHNTYGKITLARFVLMYIEHLNGHVVHVVKKRAMVGARLAIELT